MGQLRISSPGGVRRSPPESAGIHGVCQTPPDSVQWSPLESSAPVDTPFVTFCDILDSAGVRRSPAKFTGVRRSPPDHVGQCKVLGRGNLFNPAPHGGFNGTQTRPPGAPASESEKEQLHASLALYPLQPDTTEGRATYGEQMRTWKC